MSRYHDWEIEGDCRDGARISRLRFRGRDLLTAAPADFVPPRADHGRYELRPVYGYDDCFPTVDSSGEWPDHGELCWLAWEGVPERCSVRSRRWPVTFQRELRFEPARLRWLFALHNHGSDSLAFQHVMHPLMPLGELDALELPHGEAICAATRGPALDRERLAGSLLGAAPGAVHMVFLRDIDRGRVSWRLRGGLRVTLEFPRERFPTLGIWWNNGGYPAETGRQRCECAFEPVPGRSSALREGATLRAGPRSTVRWSAEWRIS